MEPLSVLSVRNENLSLGIMFPFLIYILKLFLRNLQGVSSLVHLIVTIIASNIIIY